MICMENEKKMGLASTSPIGNLRFIRDFNDWELDMVGNLLHVLRGHRITLEENSVF